MKNDIVSALVSLRPGALWTLRGDTYSGLDWQDSSQTKPTETEITNKIIALDEVEPVRLLRIQRDRLLKESDWVIVKQIDTGIAVSDDWKTYRQQLRDLPANTSDPENPTWPTKPS
tara:strand:+ start:193 stop:540 length:348 start_codon:yes stop_codon:yes gene_type:complete